MKLGEDGLVSQIVLHCFGDAKINHLRHGPAIDGRDKDVRRLEVAVDDALLVRMLDRLADGNEKLETLARRELVLVTVCPLTISMTK